MASAGWFVYFLTCSDGTLYCGITNDLAARLAKHNSGKGAKYTAVRLPVKLSWSTEVSTKSAALKLEHSLKQLTRKQKLELIKNA